MLIKMTDDDVDDDDDGDDDDDDYHNYDGEKRRNCEAYDAISIA